MLIYLAGPYTAKTDEDLSENIQEAENISKLLWREGHTVISPHLNTKHFEKTLTGIDWVDRYERVIVACDCIILLDNWKDSPGTLRELDIAMDNNIPIFEYSSWDLIKLYESFLNK